MKYRVRSLEDLRRVFISLKDRYITDSPDIDIDIEVSDHEDEATDEQKKYRWAIIDKISKNYSVDGKQFSKEAWNEYFKREFIGINELPSGTVMGVSPKGKQVMSDFIAQIEVYAAEHEINIE